MNETLAKLRLSELYKLAVNGEDLGCTVKAVHLDPFSKSLFIAFTEPYRVTERVCKSRTITDSSVKFARLDVDANGNPLALEIIPKEED